MDSDSGMGEKVLSIPSSETMEADKFWVILVSTSTRSSNLTFFLFRLNLVTTTGGNSSTSSAALVILIMAVPVSPRLGTYKVEPPRDMDGTYLGNIHSEPAACHSN